MGDSREIGKEGEVLERRNLETCEGCEMSTKRSERDEQREIGLDYGKRRDAESVFVRFVRCWKVSEVLGVF